MSESPRNLILRQAEIIRRSRGAKLRRIKPGGQQRVLPWLWTAIRCAVGHERFARDSIIERCGNRCFLPRIHDGKHGASLTALFPGYVFVSIQINHWLHLQYAPGVIQVMKVGDKPAIIQDEDINQLLSAMGEDGYLELAPAPYKPKPNELVRINSGLFEAQIARYLRHTPDNRIMLLLKMFGKEAEFEVSRKQIDPLRS